MKFIDFLKIALEGLKANRTRSALTMLGIIIGIASVVSILSLGQGTQSLILGQIVAMGSNNIFVEPGAWDPKKVSMMEATMEEFEVKTLTYDDAKAIEKLPEIEMVAPFVMGIRKVIYKDINKKITFLGTTPTAQKIDNTHLVLGREITDGEVQSQATVALLGYKIKEDLFGEEDPIAKTIRIGKTNFRVVGVLEELGSQMFMNLDEYIYLPITTAQKLLLGIDHIRWLVAKVESEDKVDEAVENIRLVLRERHNIYNPENDLSKDDFRVMSQKETAAMLTTITNILTIFLSAVAAIALVVGGIGIMNIMLVSVTERTREIGLRKAVGAKRKDILYQFLLEAITLTLLGGIIGIILGIAGAFLGGIVLGNLLDVAWDFTISLRAIALALGVAVVVGLIFGIYPARKAALLSPIDALRYE